MLWLELIMIAIGLTFVILSFRVSDYGGLGKDRFSDSEEFMGESMLTQESLEDFQSQLEEDMEEAVLRASDDLARISNEKLMGMDEYSNQVLEKISKNHEEVVFLYQMLTEREEELKKLIQQLDNVKAQIHDEALEEYHKMALVLKQLEKKRESLGQELGRKKEPAVERIAAVSVSQEREERNAAYDEEIRAIEEAEEKVQPKYFPKMTDQEGGKEDGNSDGESNHNRKILDLYKKGHSILEISRMLSLGQGEVKFVIDLHGAR